MAITTIDDLLSVETMTGILRTFANQAEERTCTRLFESSARRINPRGKSATWQERRFNRGFAPVTGIYSPHTQVRRLGRAERSSPMAMIKAYKDLPAPDLFLDRAPGSDFAEAEQVLSDELLDLANLIANTREFLACGALLGQIVVNDQTVPGSEVEFAVDFNVRTDRAQVSWADETSKIRSQELIRLKRNYKDQAGPRAGVAITEPNVEGYLVQNREVQTFVKEALGVTIMTNVNLTGQNVQWAGLGGLSWRFTDGVYEDQAGNVQRYFPENRVVILPAGPLRDVLGWAEGRHWIPAGGVFSGAQGATGLVREVRGFYAYARLWEDPVGVRVFAGWYGLPIVLNPRAVYVYNTVPSVVATP